MKVAELFEARRNPEQNLKMSTTDKMNELIEKYGDDLYVSFQNVSFLSTNTNPSSNSMPAGIYAFPVSVLKKYGIRKGATYTNRSHAFFIVPRSGIKMLDMQHDNDPETLQKLLAATKKRLKEKVPAVEPTAQAVWQAVRDMFDVAARRRRKKYMFALNAALRAAGFDAVVDRGDSKITDDIPGQIIFLHPKAYTVVHSMHNRAEEDRPWMKK